MIITQPNLLNCVTNQQHACKILVGTHEGKRPLGKHKH